METGSVFFLFTTGISMNKFQPHQITLSSLNCDATNLVRFCERRDRLIVLNWTLRKESHLLVYARGRAQTDFGF